MHHKRIFIASSIIVLIFLILCLFFFFPIQLLGVNVPKNSFALEFLSTPSECNLNDEINISVSLKSNFIHSMCVSHGVSIISINYFEEGTDRSDEQVSAIPAIGKTSYFLPYQKITESKSIKFEHPGNYVIKALATFSINDISYKYENQFIITVTGDE